MQNRVKSKEKATWEKLYARY